MIVASLMTPAARAVSSDLPLDRAVWLMGELALRHLPVVDHDRLIGIVSERDLLDATGWEAHRYLDADRRPRILRDVMSVPVETVAPDEDPAQACSRLIERGIGCLPVVEGTALVGMLSEVDFLRAFLRLSRQGPAPSDADPPVAQVMSAATCTVETSASIPAAWEACLDHGIRHLPVLHEGWFVGLVSDRDLRRSSRRAEFDHLTVGEIMATDIVTVSPADPLSAVAEILLRHRIGSVMVTENRRLLGIVTSADILARCCRIDWAGQPEAHRRASDSGCTDQAGAMARRVGELMTTHVKTCHAHEDLRSVAQSMWDHDCGVVPVVDDDARLVGMITDRDICMAACLQDRRLAQLCVRDAMARRIRSCSRSDGLERALSIMAQAQVRRLPVVDESGKLVGLISLNDVARAAFAERKTGRHGYAVQVAETLGAICERRSGVLPAVSAPAASASHEPSSAGG